MTRHRWPTEFLAGDETLSPIEDEAVPTAKWGPCHSCGCRGFKSTPRKDNICGDCSHHWEMHY